MNDSRLSIAVFTDNDFDKVNGVTTTLRSVLRYAPSDLRPRIYTSSDLEVDQPEYLALRSSGVPIPYYNEMRMYVPRVGELGRRMTADGIGLIHMTTPGPAGLAARYLARRTRLPLVGSFHTQLAEYTTLLSGSRQLGRAMREYLKWIYRGCQRVLVPSADTGRRLANDGWRTDHLVVWPRGVDVEVFTPARRSQRLRDEWHVSDRRPAVLYAGRLSVEKGLALIEPLGSLLHRHGIAHRFVLVGEGPMTPTLKERCPDAVFTGRLNHDEVATAMASADVFVFPSETDTAGNVVLEAQACGLPVLVTNAGGPKENMRNGETGFVCRPGDVLDFCSRVSELLTDAERRRRMSDAARRFAMLRPWRASLEPLYSLYREATTQPLNAPLHNRISRPDSRDHVDSGVTRGHAC
jgi:glycosyltransferase involved in cell wall biosynthesis